MLRKLPAYNRGSFRLGQKHFFGGNAQEHLRHAIQRAEVVLPEKVDVTPGSRKNVDR